MPVGVVEDGLEEDEQRSRQRFPRASSTAATMPAAPDASTDCRWRHPQRQQCDDDEVRKRPKRVVAGVLVIVGPRFSERSKRPLVRAAVDVEYSMS